MAQNTCLEDGCDNPAKVRGRCKPCDGRARRSGQLAPILRRAVTVQCHACDSPVSVTGRRRERTEAGLPVYCSTTCKNAGKRVKATCAKCGGEFGMWLSYARKHGSGLVYCSAECRKGSPMKPRTGQEITCEVCSTPMWAKPSEVGKKRFCSVPCKDKSQRVNQLQKACQQCGRHFAVRPFLSGRKFCSNRCHIAYDHANGRGSITPDGYRVITIPGRPGVRIFEHRHVMQMALGRELLQKEEVHHRNGVRHDNRLENLELWNRSHPAGQRAEDKATFAREMLALYGSEVERQTFAEFAPATVALP